MPIVKSLSFVCIFLLSSNVWAAIPAKSKAVSQDKERAVMSLGLPLANRRAVIGQESDKYFNQYRQLAFDNQQSLQVRWRALTTMGRINPAKAEGLLEKALKSKQWFMRNAGILALAHGDREKTVQWAQKLLDDSALVVRTAAVQTIHRINATEVEPLLWKKLYSKENFNRGKSLWVRKHIVKTLASFAQKGQELRFLTILNDKDKRLHPYAIKALEKITGRRLGERADSWKSKRARWLKWGQGQARS